MRRHYVFILITIFALGITVLEELQNREPPEVLVTASAMTLRDDRAVPAIDAPQFESVRAADTHLGDDWLGIAVSYNGSARFYPYQILGWHEVVNDIFGGVPILVTYSPLSGSSVVFERERDGITYTFESSNTVLNSTLLMEERETGTRFSQLQNELTIYPSTVMTWAEWKADYPNGSVLSRDTGFDMDYTSSPYPEYDTSSDIFYPLAHLDSRLPPKTLVQPRDGIVSFWFAWAAFNPGVALPQIVTP